MDPADSLLNDDLGYGQGFFHRLPQTVFRTSPQGDLCALQAAGQVPTMWATSSYRSSLAPTMQ